MEEVIVDCDAGRRLGCETFCCRLIVRYREDEGAPLGADGRPKRCVDKDPVTGLCVHLDGRTHLCLIWNRRPAICGAYDCNQDPLVQIVLRDRNVSLKHVLRAPEVPPERWQPIPKK